MTPPKPNLNYDRKQAKKLLKAARATNFSALSRLRTHVGRLASLPSEAIGRQVTLADAQHVIAREAGFSSWTMLKAHIQAQTEADLLAAFKTAVSEADATKTDKLLRRFPLLRQKIDEPLFSFASPALVVANKDRALTEVLLKHGATLNVLSGWEHGGFGALHHAAPDVAALLIGKGIEVDIHAAAELDRFADVERLLNGNPHLVDAPGGDGKRPLHFAKTVAMQQLLLARGATIDQRDSDHLATSAQHKVSQPELCRHLLQQGATADIFMAAGLGDVALIEQFVAADPSCLTARIGDGAYTAVPDAPGLHVYFYEFGGNYLPHQVALKKGKTAALEALLALSQPKERLLLACWEGDEAMVSKLLAGHPDLPQALGERDHRMLADAAWENRLAAVRLLLRCGADPQVRSDHDSTPLDRAAFHGFADVVALLLQHNPPLTVRNGFGSVPLETAVYGQTHSWRKDGEFDETIRLLGGGK